MKRTFLIGVAAGALLAGANIASAQMSQQPAASGGAGGGAVEQKGGAAQKADPKGKAMDTKGQAQGGMKADTKADSKGQAADTKGQGGMKADTKADAKGQGAAQKADDKSTAQKPDAKGGADSKAAAGGGKNLNPEQKTKIRETVIKSGPRVTNVNFTVSVGTVIPRTVTLAPLPTILIDLYPEYRSYRYVIVDDRIIIIEPSSFKIVTIIVI